MSRIVRVTEEIKSTIMRRILVCRDLPNIRCIVEDQGGPKDQQDVDFIFSVALRWMVFGMMIFGVGCAVYQVHELERKYGEPSVVNRRIKTPSPDAVSFNDDVLPILTKRCDVCHSCYDAPCQLKMTCFEGIDRGGSKKIVYDSARLIPSDPTRLFVDADSTEKWRGKSFHPVLNERIQSKEANLENSLFVKLLEQKKAHPLPDVMVLPDVFDLRLDHKYICTTIEEYDQFKDKYPLWGMPYALPGLTETEHKTLVDWVSQGALAETEEPVSEKAAAVISDWETFLNGSSPKEQLMSRYIYEHLFIGRLHFENLGDREFYRIVRSATPPGQPVREINSVRPYDDPGVTPFYYRLKRVKGVIAVKDHTVYPIGPGKMERFQELFLHDDYEVTELPGYDKVASANPFKTFAQIPAESRYRFMLDNARFFVMGFIKGPVCRGQIALNVINDHFVVAFTDPATDPISKDTQFLSRVSDLLRLPSEEKSNMKQVVTWFRYRNLQKEYLAARSQYLTKLDSEHQGRDLAHIWDGDKKNDNALLTIFRHFDSASVVKGFVGKVPKTAWIMDFPLLERTHYLLVAGFNVYGNVGHQAESRIHMDYLRMEGESNFLSYLPRESRTAIWEHWYEDARKEASNYLVDQFRGLESETGIKFKTDDPKTEFLEMLLTHVGNAADPHDHLNRCAQGACTFKSSDGPLTRKADSLMQRLGGIKGRPLQAIPDVTFVHVVMNGKEKDLVYSLIRNKALSNNSLMFQEDRRRRIDDDSLSVVRGYVGSYPNAFSRINIDSLETALSEYGKIKDEVSYFDFACKYTVRRNSPDFWDESDWHYRAFLKQHPVEGGVFDMYRFHPLGTNFDAGAIEW